MTEPYTVIPDRESQDQLTLSADSASHIKAEVHRAYILRFGSACRHISLQVNQDVPTDTICLSENILLDWGLSSRSRYELTVTDGHIHIGPFIGLLIADTEAHLRRRLRHLSRYTRHAAAIHGMLMAFSLSGVNRRKQRISSYFYDSRNDTWRRALLPYPDAVFNVITLSYKWRQHFFKALGDRLFNDYRFNKWEMYQLLSQHPGIREFLPETHLVTQPENLLRYLEKWGSLYVKPVSGSLGRNIFHLKKNPTDYTLKTHRGKRLQRYCFNSEMALVRFLFRQLKRERRYIFQPLLRIHFDQKIHDFRLIVVKDDTGQWQDIGLIGRLGKKGAVVSSSVTGAHREPGEMTIQKIVNDKSQSERARKTMSRVALKAARLLDDGGHHYGNFGVDLALDQNHKVWLIEVNCRDPQHYKAARAGRKDLVEKACRSNLLYAKRLAGFFKESILPPQPIQQNSGEGSNQEAVSDDKTENGRQSGKSIGRDKHHSHPDNQSDARDGHPPFSHGMTGEMVQSDPENVNEGSHQNRISDRSGESGQDTGQTGEKSNTDHRR